MLKNIPLVLCKSYNTTVFETISHITSDARVEEHELLFHSPCTFDIQIEF